MMVERIQERTFSQIQMTQIFTSFSCLILEFVISGSINKISSPELMRAKLVETK